MTAFEHLLVSLRRYAVFRGRATRAEYWYFCVAVGLLALILGLAVDQTASEAVAIVFLLPYVSVTVRRLHDTGRTGWWALLLVSTWIPVGFVDLVSGLVLLYFLIDPSDVGENKYGEHPDPVVRELDRLRADRGAPLPARSE